MFDVYTRAFFKRTVTLTLLFAMLTMLSRAALADTINLANNDKIHIVGRYVASENASIKMSYPGVSTTFNAVGKRASLSAKSNTGNGRIDVLINDEYSHTLHIKAEQTEYPLFFSPQGQRKQVTLLNRSESWQSINHLLSLNIEDGYLLEASPLPTRNLLVIGDSVTCGAAVSRGAQCDTQINGHDIRNSYGYLLGKKLDANVHLVCFGGRGIIRSWDENPKDIQAPAFFEKALPFKDIDAPWDHTKYQADAVIVSLGTNDFNPGIPERKAFVDTFARFMQTIHQTHPQSKLFITEGAMLNDGNPERQNKTIVSGYMKQIVKQAALAELVHVPANHYPGDACDPHPTSAQHELMAQDLEATLRNYMFW